jgi:pimeloyl-ACP methyl ester carboxylesterase
MQADALAGLLRQLDMAPAVIIGGSGGARVSLLTVAQHPDVAAAVAMWWMSGGIYGLMVLGTHYCGGNIAAAWKTGTMEAVAALPEWQEAIARNPSNRQRILDQDPAEFIAGMEHWMSAYYPRDGELIPGLLDEDARKIEVPALVFRSGVHDANHTRETSERLAALLPTARLLDPPWSEDEWNERSSARPGAKGEGLFINWPKLAPLLDDWAREALGDPS